MVTALLLHGHHARTGQRRTYMSSRRTSICASTSSNLSSILSYVKMGGLESVATGVIDKLGDRIKQYRWHREIVMAIIIGGSFLVALCGATNVSNSLGIIVPQVGPSYDAMQ